MFCTTNNGETWNEVDNCSCISSIPLLLAGLAARDRRGKAVASLAEDSAPESLLSKTIETNKIETYLQRLVKKHKYNASVKINGTKTPENKYRNSK